LAALYLVVMPVFAFLERRRPPEPSGWQPPSPAGRDAGGLRRQF
jgi:hypothetical protein